MGFRRRPLLVRRARVPSWTGAASGAARALVEAAVEVEVMATAPARARGSTAAASGAAPAPARGLQLLGARPRDDPSSGAGSRERLTAAVDVLAHDDHCDRGVADRAARPAQFFGGAFFAWRARRVLHMDRSQRLVARFFARLRRQRRFSIYGSPRSLPALACPRGAPRQQPKFDLLA